MSGLSGIAPAVLRSLECTPSGREWSSPRRRCRVRHLIVRQENKVLAGGRAAQAAEQSDVLAGGPGERQSITDSKQFRAAKKKLGIMSHRDGFGRGGRWYWSMSTQPFLLARFGLLRRAFTGSPPRFRCDLPFTWAGLSPAGSHQLAAGAPIRSPHQRV